MDNKITVTSEDINSFELDDKTKIALIAGKYAFSWAIGSCSDRVIKDLISSITKEDLPVRTKIIYTIGRMAISGSISYLVKKNIEKTSIFAEASIKGIRIYKEKCEEIKNGTDKDGAETGKEETGEGDQGDCQN